MLRNLFAFKCQGKRYKYNCLPQGWASAPSAFHSRICNILTKTKAIVYVDDLLVGGRSQEDHDKNLGEVLARLQEARMHVNRDKIQLSKNHFLFLGYDISGGSYGLDSYIAAQQKRLPQVASKGEIRKFLGIFNLCRLTCPGLG